MTDQELMDLAKRTMAAAAEEAPGSVEREVKWAAHESVMNELRRRIARKIGAELGLPDVDL